MFCFYVFAALAVIVMTICIVRLINRKLINLETDLSHPEKDPNENR